MSGIKTKAEGAWNIVLARALYNEDGSISYLKSGVVVSTIAAGVFFCPTFLSAVIGLGLFCGFLYLVCPVIKALFDGRLDEAAEVRCHNPDP